MKTSTIQFRANEVVKTLPSSGYKMGDKKTLNVKLSDGTIVTAIHDTREYYSGRGSKYNRSIRHGNIVETMTVAQLNKAWKPIAAEMLLAKKRAIDQKRYLETCKNPDFIAAKAAEAVQVVGRTNRENGPKDYDWTGNEDFANSTNLSHYHGCGVYRTGWRNGKMTCTLYQGFHGSCPYGIEQGAWLTAVVAEMKKYSDHIVKMDGSGTEFFFRSMEDADLVTIATEVYYVPDTRGGLHLNIQPAEAEIIEPKRLTQG